MSVREELQAVMDSKGFGSGAAYRRRKRQESEILDILPPPSALQPVWAAPDSGHVPMAHFGNSSEDGKDWGLYWEGRGSQCDAFGDDARTDALIVAAIINAYRMGLLVRADDG